MPLHLLGKKSWNVYNEDNIARVRRDEAAAKAAEEAEEQRMQEIDAQRRLAILRGETPPPLEDEKYDEPPRIEQKDSGTSRATYSSGLRRKRKRQGEDDTDYELRLAKERNDVEFKSTESARKPTSSAPIVDHTGRIDLFGDERARAYAEKNEEAEEEAKKKKREYEDQYTLRFSNAAGKDGTNKPWYSQSEGVAPDSSSKDVWGREDPSRKGRDSQRIVADDPLAMMKKGASQVRQLKKERKRLQEERDEELRQLRKEGHRGRHSRNERESRDRADSRKRHSRRRRSRERSRDRYGDRDSHRERRRHKEDERRRRHRDSRSHSPDRRSHRHKGDERR